jgi:RimJ/RimL family protein N-acetyltransferase
MTPTDGETGYPVDLDAHLTLNDDRHVHIRALHRCESAPIRALHARLSPLSRYRRFLSPMPTLPESLVQRLSCVDHRSCVAIVAEDERNNDFDVVALASFSEVDEGVAELAIVVLDEWQGQGMGGALVERLLDAAEGRGFTRFVASVTSDNTPMRKLMDRLVRVTASRTSYGVSDFWFERVSGSTAPASTSR